MIRLIACILTLTLGSTALAGVTTVRLLTGARVSPDAPVTIADLATLEGPQAEAIGALVVIEDLERAQAGERYTTVPIARVSKLIEGLEGLRMGSVAITGTACVVAPRGPARAAPAAPPEKEPVKPAPTGPTVRSSLLDHLRAFFGVEAHELRVTFDPQDDEALDTPIGDRQVEVRSLGSSRRMPFAVTLYDADRVAFNTTIRAEVELLRPVAVATRRVSRGTAITTDDVTSEHRWVGVDDTSPAPEQVIGRVLTHRLDTGDAVGAGDIEQPVAVGRGDITSIRSVVGSAVIRTKARALASGGIGDVIEFQSTDRGAKFLARIDGPGRAVVAPATLTQVPTP